jgi:WD40 repeat protein
MPFWNSIDNGMSKQRLVDVAIVDEGRWVVASYFSIEQSTKQAIDLSVSVLDSVDTSKRMEIRDRGLTSAKVSPNGAWIAMGYRDGRIALTDPKKSREPFQWLPKLPEGRQVRDFHWSSDGQFLLVRMEKTAWIWDSIAGTLLKEISLDSHSEVVVLADADCFSACSGGIYRLFEWQSGLPVQEVPIESAARSVTFSSDLKYAAYLLGAELRVVEFSSGIPVWGNTHRVPSSTKAGIAFSTDDRVLAFVQHDIYSGDYLVRVVDIGTESEIGSHVFGKNSIAGVTFQNDSIWAWECNGRICKWDCGLPVDNAKLVIQAQFGDGFE